jgi:hypothetical protein
MPAGFLLAEDAAVKGRFSNIAVSDDRNSSRPVSVFFRYPDGETEKHYPFITVELVDLVHNRSLQLSETAYYYDGTSKSTIDYYPSESTASDLSAIAPSGSYLKMDSFVPVTLVYQISTYTRSALHDRQLTSKLLRRVTPFRRGFIEIPEDGTIRRFDLMGWTSADLLDQESGYKKRVFRKVYTLQMNAEIPTSDINTIKKVATVVGNITNVDNENPTVFTNSFSEDF